MENDNVKIISYLNILELPIDQPINAEIVNGAYRKLSKIYHPDVANDRYKDGKKFIELQNARDYLIANVDIVNSAISNGFSSSFSTSDAAYEHWKQEQEFKRRQQEEQEKKRRAEEAERRRREQERRKQEEQKRKIEAEERWKREEQELRKKIEAAKAVRLNDAKILLDGINKEEYYEDDYSKISSFVMDFVSFLNGISVFTDQSTFNSIETNYNSMVESVRKVKTIKKKKEMRGIFISAASTCVILAALLIVVFTVLIPFGKYKTANNYMKKGDYQKAQSIYSSMSYKNSANLNNICDSLLSFSSKKEQEMDESFYDELINYCNHNEIAINFKYDLDGGGLENDSSQQINFDSYIIKN